MLEKIRNSYRKRPNLLTAVITLLAGIMAALIMSLPTLFQYDYGLGDMAALLAAGATVSMFIFYPAVLTFQNLWQICRFSYQQEMVKTARITDAVTILWGAFCTCTYLSFSETDIRMADWNETLFNRELHTPIATWTFPTIAVIGAAALIGYLILRYIPLQKLPPLVSVLSMAAMYLGAGLCILCCIQLLENEFFLVLYPFNLLLVFGKTVRQVCVQHEQGKKWSGLAFLVMWPLLGVLIAVLILFGQRPDSIIQAWTQTSDWTLSLKEAPPNVQYDEHYLCTVAAGGHPKVVKPLRMGVRHGHRIVVNRQLLIANAFEDLLAEKLPGTHRRLRGFYDAYGYPIAKHIRTRRAADIVYLMMKPLEYFFLIVLYLFDAEPENRIAVQYLGGDCPAAGSGRQPMNL